MELDQGLFFDAGHVRTRDAEAFRHLALGFPAAAAKAVPEADYYLFPAFEGRADKPVELLDSLFQVNLLIHSLILAAKNIYEGNLVALLVGAKWFIKGYLVLEFLGCPKLHQDFVLYAASGIRGKPDPFFRIIAGNGLYKSYSSD